MYMKILSLPILKFIFSFIAVTSFVSLGECLETSTQGADIGRSVYNIV